MNSFEINKVLGAILGTCLTLLALNIVADALFSPEKPAKPGYLIKVAAQTGATKAAVNKKEVPLPVRLAKAEVEKGQNIAKQCQVCHDLTKGGPNKIGPNLWNIVGNARGEGRGFKFSAAMKAKGGKWSYDEIDKFLTNPRGYIPGTLMTFAGISNDQQRADVIDYLHTLSDNPLPLPKPTAKEKAAAKAAQQPAVAAQKAPAKPAPKEASLPALLSKASVDKGKEIAKQCQICHTLGKGDPNKIGPNLYDIVGNERGTDRNGYNFSAAMKAKGGKWTYDEIFKFLKDPRGYIPGTAMTFAGIGNDQQRADVIDYLHTLSDNPVPLPKAQAQNAPTAPSK